MPTASSYGYNQGGYGYNSYNSYPQSYAGPYSRYYNQQGYYSGPPWRGRDRHPHRGRRHREEAQGEEHAAGVPSFAGGSADMIDPQDREEGAVRHAAGHSGRSGGLRWD